MNKAPRRQLAPGELNELRRWNTPTIYNGWEQVTKKDPVATGFNAEPVHDYMPYMGPMVGYAVTVVVEPSNRAHVNANPKAWAEYRSYVAAIPGPKIVVVQDLDKPRTVGAFWGEVNSGAHRAIGCVGTIIDGAIRDLDEMAAVGFKALARTLCIGHAFSHPVRWGHTVEVFGRTVEPGQLIHADKHGFLAVPFGDERGLLDAARFMDSLECHTLIAATQDYIGRQPTEVVRGLARAGADFGRAARRKFRRRGEW